MSFRLRRSFLMELRGHELAAVMGLWLLTQLIVGSLAARWADRTVVNAIGAAALANSALIVLIPVVLRGFGIPLYQVGLHLCQWRKSLAFGVWSLFVWGPATIVLNFLVRTEVGQKTPHPVQTVLEASPGIGHWLLLAYAVVVTAPLSEELLFRGVFQGWLGNRLPPVAAALLAAVLFAFAHSTTWPDPIPLAVLGFGIGIAFQRSRSLVAPVTMHALFNGFNLLLGAVAKTAQQS